LLLLLLLKERVDKTAIYIINNDEDCD